MVEHRNSRGQQVHQRPVRVVRLSTRIGTQGTRVTLRAGLLPAVTPVQLAIGATRSGFEELALHQTDGNGDLTATVEVPDWTRRDQPARFIVFNLYFSQVFAESGIFHVTDERGSVVREGEVAGAGEGCLVLRGDDEETYRLSGSTGSLAIGERATLEGVVSEDNEGCGDNISLTLRVESVGSAGPRP